MRHLAGIAMQDLGFEEPWLVVDAEVDGPVRFPDLWGVPEAAKARGSTRSLAAVQIAGERLHKAIVAIGNAPTALLGLLALMEERADIRPALVVGMPVGFVNAAESKELLQKYDIPSITIQGRKGGSPLAAATINALAELALQNDVFDNPPPLNKDHL